MKLKFDREVRKSIAEELKKISNFGGVGLGFMGYSSNSPVILLGAFIWWIVCQTISHLSWLFKTKKRKNKMTIEIAALLGMGLIALWGVIALLFAIKTAKISHHIDTDTGAIHSG